MKILQVAWHVDNKKLGALAFSYTGGSIVINNLIESLGKREDVYLFLGIVEMPSVSLDDFVVVQTDNVPEKLVEQYRQDAQDYKELRLKCRTYSFEKALQEIQPDIVNFHDIGQMAQRCIEICKQYDMPFVVTNHLFIGKNPGFTGYEDSQKIEERFFNNTPVELITVSIGQKNKIIKNYPHYPEHMIQPIPNGTDYVDKKKYFSIREKHNINECKKILLSSGSVIERKNHAQIVSSLNLLPEEIKNNIVIVICGKGKELENLRNLIADNGMSLHVILTGVVEPEDMPSYYAEANGYVMPSKAEGLSISALEAMTFGLPIILFYDSECIEELRDDNIVSIADERTDLSFADAIEAWFKKAWDKKYIQLFSKRFTMERMTDGYLAHYRRLLESSDAGKSH
nr:glycosyltransferase family 4 protein [uncultured Desulfobacter sp.]